MLVLTRGIGQSIVAGKNFEIEFTILDVNRKHVKIGINAPDDIPVHRREIANKIITDMLKQKDGSGD